MKPKRSTKAKVDFTVDQKAVERAARLLERVSAKMPGVLVRERDVWRMCFLTGLEVHAAEYELADPTQPKKRRRDPPAEK